MGIAKLNGRDEDLRFEISDLRLKTSEFRPEIFEISEIEIVRSESLI